MPASNSGVRRPLVRGLNINLAQEGLTEAARLYPGLTYRQLQVWKFVITGATNLEIAKAMHLTEDTIKTHLTRIMKNLGLEGSERHRAHIAVLGVRSGAFVMRPIDPMKEFKRRLSGREAEVLQGLAEGLTNREIGDRLGITPATVKSHLYRITPVIGTGDRTKMAVRAWRAGLIS